jgi:hypothetical protein
MYLGIDTTKQLTCRLTAGVVLADPTGMTPENVLAAAIWKVSASGATRISGAQLVGHHHENAKHATLPGGGETLPT